MNLEVELKPEVEAMLQQRALDRGFSVADYVEQLIERDILSAQSFDHILAPIRKGFQESGLSDEQLNSLFEEERDAAFRERQAKGG